MSCAFLCVTALRARGLSNVEWKDVQLKVLGFNGL